MKIYFLSSLPCALTLNGAYFGITDTFERYAEIALTDRVYAQFSPEGSAPIGFFITESLLSTPPFGCEVYLLADGVAVYAKEFPPTDFTLRPVTQARFENGVISVFFQGVLQISIETEKGFFIATLPPSFSYCTLSAHGDLFFVEGENCLAIYTDTGKCVFLEKTVAYSVEGNVLNATLPLFDCLGRSAKCAWELRENGLIRTQFTLVQNKTHEEETDIARQEELLAYAFFESLLIEAEYTSFLSEALLPKASKLRSFLGDFKGVVPTDEPLVCGLIREKSARLFQVDYFAVTIEDGKISDVSPFTFAKNTVQPSKITSKNSPNLFDTSNRFDIQ